MGALELNAVLPFLRSGYLEKCGVGTSITSFVFVNLIDAALSVISMTMP